MENTDSRTPPRPRPVMSNTQHLTLRDIGKPGLGLDLSLITFIFKLMFSENYLMPQMMLFMWIITNEDNWFVC